MGCLPGPSRERESRLNHALNVISLAAVPQAAALADVAQLDRAPDYGSGGWGFESSHLHSSTRSPDAAIGVRPLQPAHLRGLDLFMDDPTGLKAGLHTLSGACPSSLTNNSVGARPS